MAVTEPLLPETKTYRQKSLVFGETNQPSSNFSDAAASFRSIADISVGLEKSWGDKSRDWRGSPFEWILGRRPATVGAVGVAMVGEWARTLGLYVGKSSDREADMTINGSRVEVKLSTLWQSGEYRFQQLRDQNYDLVVCLGLSPSDAHCWVIPKVDLFQLREAVKEIRGQHCGATGGGDTFWLSVHPGSPPPWASKFGGTVQQAASCLRSVVRQCH